MKSKVAHDKYTYLDVNTNHPEENNLGKRVTGLNPASLNIWNFFSGAVFVHNPINRETVATFEIIVSVHDNASEVIDKSGSVPNGKFSPAP